MHAHLRSRYIAGPAGQPGLHLRREGLGGYVGQRLRHMARPAGTGCHATGRERLPPQHHARTHKHHQRVCVCETAPKKTKSKKKKQSTVCHGVGLNPPLLHLFLAQYAARCPSNSRRALSGMPPAMPRCRWTPRLGLPRPRRPSAARACCCLRRPPCRAPIRC